MTWIKDGDGNISRVVTPDIKRTALRPPTAYARQTERGNAFARNVAVAFLCAVIIVCTSWAAYYAIDAALGG